MKLSKLFSFKSWSLKARVSALVALPLIFITLLTVFNIKTALDRETVNLQSRGEKLQLLAADASQLALFAGDTSSLNTLSSAIKQDSQIADVLFYDEEKNLLSGQTHQSNIISNREFIDGMNYIEGEYWYFIKSVQLKQEFLEEDQEQYAGSPDATPLGWVIVAVELGESRAYQTVILGNNLLIALLMLSIALWLAFRFSHAVVGPIANITLAVGRYGDEDFSQRVDEVSAGELGTLEKGINILAERVGQSQQILKQEVEKATKDLALKNVDLEEAKEAADAANMAKDDFLARMSHELRTPLTGIMGFTRLLATTDQDDLRKEYSEMIIKSSSVLLSTINDILDFSKSQANSFSLNPVRFNLENCLRNVLDLHRVSAFDKGIELNVLIDSDIPVEIFTDIDKLQKVVNNIVGNAVKFTPEGDIVMFVSLTEQQGKEALITISVKDTGLGISPENIKYLFNPFYQSDESNTRRYDGTGLGLAIAEDFIILMGGSISVDSEEGEGTEVEFSFRCKVIIDAAERHVEPDSFRAIVFDNNPWTRRSWRNQLLKYSDEVSVPSSLAELISQLSSGPDMLLIGINYPAYNLEQADWALKQIRAEYSGAIILAVADDGSAVFESLSDAYGPLEIISKPLTNNRLLGAMEKVSPALAADLNPVATDQPQINSLTFNSTKSIAGLELLVAEDNRFNQTLLSRLLEAAGASVTLANDGLEAMKHCEQHLYDVLIVDLHMPGLNGLQLSSAIRASKEHLNNTTPIVLLTADVQSKQESEILESGVSSISYKPIDEGDLIDKISMLSTKAALAGPATKRALISLSSTQISEEVGRQLQLIERALEDENLDSLTDQVHQLAGMVGLSGLDSIDDLVQNLNSAVLAMDLAEAKQCYKRLARFWSNVKV